METEEALETTEKPQLNEILQTHLKIQENHSYELLALDAGFARVRMQTRRSEKIDDTPYIYEAALFSCANFCAVASVNEMQNHLISAKVEFLNPVKVEDEEVYFEATASTNSAGQKQIEVVATVKGIVVLESSFVLLKLDHKSLLKE